MKFPIALLFCLILQSFVSAKPLPAIEKDGLVIVEAEDFVRQQKVSKRKWERIDKDTPIDRDEGMHGNYAADASGEQYIHLLPDTRRTHADKLEHGVSFAAEGGVGSILTYDIKFNQLGTYYVWVRAYSTGSEDNGIHVGLNTKWPESGARMQWCAGKNSWKWASKQRTVKNHCGEPHLIFLEIEKPGVHKVKFSMREDGFRFDKFLLTLDRDFKPRPED